MHRSHRNGAQLFSGLRAILGYELMKRAQDGRRFGTSRYDVLQGCRSGVFWKPPHGKRPTGKQNPIFGFSAAYNAAGAV